MGAVLYTYHCLDKINILDPTVFMLGNEIHTEWVNERAGGRLNARAYTSGTSIIFVTGIIIIASFVNGNCMHWIFNSMNGSLHSFRRFVVFGKLLLFEHKQNTHTYATTHSQLEKKRKQWNTKCTCQKKNLFHSLFLSGFVFERALISHEAPWYHIISLEFALEFTFFFRD